MYVSWRQVAAIGLGLGLYAHAPAASAWVDASIQSDVITLDLVRDGTATVTHEVMLRVRGGPLHSLTLQGVDADAEPEPGATIGPALGSGESQRTSALLLSRGDDGSLRVELDDERGVKRGSYLLRFAYRTHSLQRDMQLVDGTSALLRWVGPRFGTGMDLAKVIFRLPSAPAEPRLASTDRERFGTTDDNAGTFISHLRRGPDKDELELVRPHVAQGEPVVWTALASAEAFDTFRPALRVAPIPQVAAPARPGRGRVLLLATPVVAFGYAVAVLAKWFGLRRAAHVLRAMPQSLIPLPAVARAVLAGTALAASFVAGSYARQMLLAALFAVLAMILASHATPKPLSRPRPPGRWLPLSCEDALAKPTGARAGAWFDAGRWRGLVLFVVLLGGMLVLGLAWSRSYPPGAAALALASSALVPLFFTGRASELPADAAQRPQSLLGWLLRRLRRDEALRAVPWARIPDEVARPDELRLLVLPRRPREGLIAIEVATEYCAGPGGSVELPCVVVRATEDSPSHGALPRSVVWVRGRKPRERVAILRPRLPLRSMVLSLVRNVARRLSETEPATGAHPGCSSCTISRGSIEATSKLGSVASPAHAT
ncbi:MAG: hypothetical protein JW940_10555 [Polyangiaceae bacterium]|nr:hypothetical protein [Polyangiaceae bacterium]